MINEEPEKKEDSEVPDFADDLFWQDFSRELRGMLHRSETPVPEKNSAGASRAAAPKNHSATEQTPLRRNKTCLSFSRCAEIGRETANSSAPEKAHLENCRFCVGRVEKFAANPLPMPPKKDKTAVAAIVSPDQSTKKSLWARLFSPSNENSQNRRLKLTLSFAGLAIILCGKIKL